MRLECDVPQKERYINLLTVRFGSVVTRWCRHSSSTPGPVTAWMGDRFWTRKPPGRRTRHPGLLSLGHPSVSKHSGYPAKAGEQTSTT